MLAARLKHERPIVRLAVPLFAITLIVITPQWTCARNLIRKSGRVVAAIDGDYLRRSGRTVARFDRDSVRVNGRVIATFDGRYIRKSGRVVATIDGRYIRRNGSVVWVIDDRGYIRQSGRVVYRVEDYTDSLGLKRKIATFLLFFAE